MIKYNLDFIGYVGQHIMTSTHPHNQILENTLPLEIKFNKFYEPPSEDNPSFNDYLNKLTKTAFELGAKQESIDLFISKIQANCIKVPKSNLCLVPAIPYFGPEKNFINLEEWPFLYTHLFADHTCNIDVENQDYHKVMIAALLQPNFCGILSHVKNTIETYQYLYRDYPEIQKKLVYLPLASPDTAKIIQPKIFEDKLNILITNSYGGHMPAFRVRGGFESLKAVLELINIYPEIHLTTVGIAPQIQHPRVTQYQNYLDNDIFNTIINQTHVFLVPAMRIHMIGVVKALCNGVIPIVSDGWAFDEFIKDDYNGFIANGQYNYTTWKDKNGMFRENYDAAPSNDFVSNIKEKLLKILNNKDCVSTWSNNCISFAKKKFNIERRNKILIDFIEKNYD